MTAAPEPRPIQSYWVVPGKLLAGEYPARIGRPNAAERLDSLLSAGIDSFLDLTEPNELEPYLPLLQERAGLRAASIHYQRLPLVDFDVPGASSMQTILDRIDAALAGGHRIYVHCWGGIGRTGMVVGCYLVRHGRAGSEALQQIQVLRLSASARLAASMSPETPAQVDFVLDWREHELGSA
jgi:hypothetical protein